MPFHFMRKLLCLIAVSALLPLAVASGSGASAPAPATSAKSALGQPGSASKPLWTDLSPVQKQALAPLSPEWDRMSDLGKKKWLEIANRYALMKPDEQARLQERMRDWVKLTPEQRMAARENFAKSTQVKAEHKSAQWQQYQQLSEEEKKRLASENEKKKSVTNLPANALKNPTILAPLKIGPKPVTTPTAKPVIVAPPAVVTPAPVAVPASAPAASSADATPASTPAATQGTTK
ncbi:DUF3106 domain-containing protein [Undibacterium sp. TJN19]|uniref:DUF3106 domain-containing protein n=1 Tax=Undibacterium sp. TJN19 TaxID=3413055 RepID=UPI003BF24282